MSTTVSQSPKPDDHELTRQERDNSFSTGGGRKDVEKAKTDRPKAANCADEKAEKDEKDGKECSTIKPPIGLDLETKGDEKEAVHFASER